MKQTNVSKKGVLKNKSWQLKNIMLAPYYFLKFYVQNILLLSSSKNGRNIISNMGIFLFGMKDLPIGFNSLSSSTKFSIIIQSLVVILFQVLTMYLFFKFTALESLFWKTLLGAQAGLFFQFALGVIVFKLLEGITDVISSIIKANLISKWRHDLLRSWSDRLTNDVNLAIADRHLLNNMPQVLQQSLESYVKNGFNILINFTNTIFLTVFLAVTIVQVDAAVCLYVGLAVLTIRTLLGTINYCFSSLQTERESQQNKLRNSLNSMADRINLSRALGCKKTESAAIDKENSKLRNLSFKFFSFKSVQDFIRWRLTGLFELVIFYFAAPLYFTGKFAWAKLNLVANSSVKLFYLIIDFIGDFVRLNGLNTAIDRLTELKSLSNYKLPVASEELKSKGLSLGVCKKPVGRHNWSSAKDSLNLKKGEWCLLKSKQNGAGKTTFLVDANQQYAEFAYVKSQNISGEKVKLIDRILYFKEQPGLSNVDPKDLKTIKRWLEYFNYTSNDIDLESFDRPSDGQSVKILLVQLLLRMQSSECEAITHYGLDEIFRGLDNAAKEKLGDYFVELKNSNKSIIFTTNDEIVMKLLSGYIDQKWEVDGQNQGIISKSA